MKKFLLIIFIAGVNLCLAQQNYYYVNPGNGYGIRFWDSSDNYKIHMGYGAEYFYGPVQDFSIKMNMSSGTPYRGWTWGVTGATPIAALSSQGYMQIEGSFISGRDIAIGGASTNGKIYTWSFGDANWRIGMSASPGFTTSLATSHVNYITYAASPGQGFALGVNGGQSSFEITGSNHNAFFRGSVGINTTSPIYGRFQVTQGSDASDQGIAILNSTGMRAMRIWTDANNSYVYSNGAGTSPLILNNGGNVGIGTTSPGSALSVKGRLGLRADANPSTPSETMRIEGAFSGEENVVNITNMSDQDFLVRLSGVGAAAKRTIIGPSTSTRLSLGVGVNNGNEYLTIQNGGNVGIGTVNPDYKLTVNGSIHAKEVRVDLTGALSVPDYVFEKDYKLTSLEDIKTYIDQNKHLPEVPSAKEIEKNGVQLGEMNLILLKKIEELTLHIIKQEERIKALESQTKK